MMFHWDMAIYRFSKWRPSAILELFYHHTRPPTKSLLLAAAACQISCQSGTQIWRHSNLNFSHIWVEMPIQWGFWGTLDPKCDYSSSRPPKGTSLRKSASFKVSTVKIRSGVWPVRRVDRKCYGHSHTHTHTGKFIVCPNIVDRTISPTPPTFVISQRTVLPLAAGSTHYTVHTA